MRVKSLEIHLSGATITLVFAFVRIFWDLNQAPKLPVCLEQVCPVNLNLTTVSPVKRLGIRLGIPGIRWHSQLNLKCLAISQSFWDWGLRHTHIGTLGVTGVCEWGGSRGLRSSVLPTTIIKIVWGGSAWAREGLSEEARKTPNAVLRVITVCTYQQSNPASGAGTWLTMTFGTGFYNVLLPSRSSSVGSQWCVRTCPKSTFST